nr:hypothetical protein [Tanacetum cinerariifolium]
MESPSAHKALFLAKEANDMHAGEVCAEKMNALRSELMSQIKVQHHLFLETKVDLFESPPAPAIAASSPAIDFFAATKQVLQPYYRIMPHLTDLNLHPRLVITMINGHNPTQEAFKMVQTM